MKAPSPEAKLLRELIAIPSVNPDGNPGTPHTGEKNIAEFIANFLKKSGAETRLEFVEPGRPNVIGLLRPKGKTLRRILFAPPSDTVSVAGMSISPFDPVIKNGKIFGRGATDTKGSVAAMLTALTWLKKHPSQHTEFTFVAFMGEESYNRGVRHFCKKHPEYDLAIIGEPTGMQIVHAIKGTCWLQLEAHGRAAHASMPHLGKNAIGMTLEALRRLQPKFDQMVQDHSHPELGRPTCNIGTIRGGSKINIVPDHCTTEIDIRFLPEMQMLKLLKEWAPAAKPCKLTSTRIDHPFHTPKETPLLQRIVKHCRGWATAPWFCDASILAQAGIPSIALGPGSIRQAHTRDEFITLRDLEKGTTLFQQILADLEEV